MNKVAIFGYGTIGKGVKDIIDTLPDAKVCKVFDLPCKKEELGDLFDGDVDSIINSDVDTIVECMGGDTLPYQVITKALRAGKNVISSNKETVSLHLKEYLDLANDYNGTIQFEASAGGGIPLIQPLTIQSNFDQITSILGVLNATCNFILTKMSNDNMTMEEALHLAQAKGFAEKDPTADLEGLDMVRKGSILASLATHSVINNDEIACFGISHITNDILNEFKKENRKIKFVTYIDNSANFSIVVMPIVIAPFHPLYYIDNEVNGFLINGKFNDPVTIIGKGAGRYPTAAAIVQDLERVIHHCVFPLPKLTQTKKVVPQIKGKFYVFDKGECQERINPSIEELHSHEFICKVD